MKKEFALGPAKSLSFSSISSSVVVTLTASGICGCKALSGLRRAVPRTPAACCTPVSSLSLAGERGETLITENRRAEPVNWRDW